MGRDRTSSPRKGGHPPRVERANLQAGFLVRMVALACVAVIGSAWGLIRFYTHVRRPMVVGVTAVGGPRGAWDAGAGLIEAPEIEVEGR